MNENSSGRLLEGFDHWSLSVGTSAVQLTTSTALLNFGVRVKAALANTGIVYVGRSDVTANATAATDGFELNAGEEVFIPTNDASLVYCRASASSQLVTALVV